MDPKLLTERGWKATAAKYKVKDNGLERALALYEKLEQSELGERLKVNASIAQLAASLKKLKEVTVLPEVTKYLSELANAAESNRKQLEASAAARAKDAAEAKQREEREKQKNGMDDKEEEAGDYAARLLATFQKLKSTKDLSFPFLVCDGKPHCGVMVAKRITPQHKEELSRLTGGGKRFLHPGACHFENGRFVFTMEEPVSGLARKLQDSIKFFTQKKLPIMIGTESAEAEEAQTTLGTQSSRVPTNGTSRPPLEKAPEVWHQTRTTMSADINRLKEAIRKEFAGEAPALIAEIEQKMTKLDEIVANLDQRLAHSLKRAHEASSPDGRKAELTHSKAILAEYIRYVKSSESLIAGIDSNPFGIKLNLKQMLSENFTQMAQAMQ